MWLSFALIILVATLFVIFAEEVVNFIVSNWKKMWFKLLGPLLLISYAYFEFELFLTWVFNRFKVIFFHMADAVASILPKTNWTMMATEILLLFVLTILPVFAMDRFIFYRHKTKRLNNPFYIALMIWVFLAMIYVSGVQFD